MTTTNGVQSVRRQVEWLAGVVAASMVFMFLAVALPWLVRMIEVDLAALAWTLAAFAAVHAAIVLASERIRGERAMSLLLKLVPIVGTTSMALLWHFGGGVRHPALAFAMTVPVMAAAALQRPGLALRVALLSIIAVVTVLTITSPDFGWYLTQLGVPGAALLRVAAEEPLTRDPFPGSATTPAGAFVFVATFSIVQLAAAVLAARIAAVAGTRGKWSEHVDEAGDETRLTATALRLTPAAAAVVIAESGTVVQVTKRFRQQMLLHNDPVTGHEITTLLQFADSNQVREILERGGAIPICQYRVGSEERVASLSAEAFEHDGVRYAAVVITDWTDITWLGAAAESLHEPLLVVGADARLRYANPAAGALLDGDVYEGRDVAPLLGDWWNGTEGRRHRVTVGGREFDGVATPVVVAGSERAALIRLSGIES